MLWLEQLIPSELQDPTKEGKDKGKEGKPNTKHRERLCSFPVPAPGKGWQKRNFFIGLMAENLGKMSSQGGLSGCELSSRPFLSVC